jgi:hypothetical protein
VTLPRETSKVARVSRGTRRLPRPLPLYLSMIGGPSGVGKSRLAHALARRTGSTVAQVDDLQTALQALVRADRLPEYFVPAETYLRTDSPEKNSDAIEQLAHFFAPAVHAAISNRIESGTSTVFEGDFISPDVAARQAHAGSGHCSYWARRPKSGQITSSVMVTTSRAGPGFLPFAVGDSPIGAASWVCWPCLRDHSQTSRRELIVR